jgi:hypothetical protein
MVTTIALLTVLHTARHVAILGAKAQAAGCSVVLGDDLPDQGTVSDLCICPAAIILPRAGKVGGLNLRRLEGNEGAGVVERKNITSATLLVRVTRAGHVTSCLRECCSTIVQEVVAEALLRVLETGDLVSKTDTSVDTVLDIVGWSTRLLEAQCTTASSF